MRHQGNLAFAERRFKLMLHLGDACRFEIGQIAALAEFFKGDDPCVGVYFLFTRAENFLRQLWVWDGLGQNRFQEVQQLRFIFCFLFRL